MNTRDARLAFLDFSRLARGLAPSSARLYEHILRRFELSVGENASLDAAAARAEAFLAQLGRRGVGDHARRKAFEVLRLFYRWACERGHARENPLRDARAPIVHARPRTFLRRGEVGLLLHAVRISGRMHAARDHALLATLFYAGLRVGEALRLRLDQLDLDQGELHVLGKGGKVRRVPVHRELARILRAWLRQRPEASALLFPSAPAGHARTGQLDNSRVELVLREVYAPAAGLAGRVTPHTLRRTFATELRRRNVPLEHVQRLLGHADIRTTMVYLAEPMEGLKASIGRL
jgi:site-specific recombinase XerD